MAGKTRPAVVLIHGGGWNGDKRLPWYCDLILEAERPMNLP